MLGADTATRNVRQMPRSGDGVTDLRQFDDPATSRTYIGLLEMAADPSSALYLRRNGEPSTASVYGLNFWAGAGYIDSPLPEPHSTGWIAQMAGRTWANR